MAASEWLGHVQSLGDGSDYRGGIRHPYQVDEPGTVAALRSNVRGHADRKPGLADPTRSDGGYQAMACERRGKLCTLGHPAEERAHRHLQCPAARRFLHLGPPREATPVGYLVLAQQRGDMALYGATEMNSSSAICAFVNCRPRSAKTSASRAVTVVPSVVTRFSLPAATRSVDPPHHPEARGLRIRSGETPDELLAPRYVALAVERSQVFVHGVDGDADVPGDLFAG